jgi:hypothetical protein
MGQANTTAVMDGCDIPGDVQVVVHPVFISASTHGLQVYATDENISFVQLTLTNACQEIPRLFSRGITPGGGGGPGIGMPLPFTESPTSTFDPRLESVTDANRDNIIAFSAATEVAKKYRDAHALRILRARKLYNHHYCVVVSVADNYAAGLLPLIQDLASGATDEKGDEKDEDWRVKWKAAGELVSTGQVKAFTWEDAAKKEGKTTVNQVLLSHALAAYSEHLTHLREELPLKDNEQFLLDSAPPPPPSMPPPSSKKVVALELLKRAHNKDKTAMASILKLMLTGFVGLGMAGYYAVNKYRQKESERVVDLASIDVVGIIATLAHTRRVLQKDMSQEGRVDLVEKVEDGIRKLQGLVKEARQATRLEKND